MPQTGYVVSGIKKSELSDLAQHHYLVTAIGWYLASLLKKRKGRVNLERVLEICLIHDLGELFGGDIAMPYAKDNPAANKLAKKFEQVNQKYLSKFLPDPKQAAELFGEANVIASIESVVAKLADYIEVTEYKLYLGRLTEGDVEMVVKRMNKMIEKIKHVRTREKLSELISEWSTDVSDSSGYELFEAAKRL